MSIGSVTLTITFESPLFCSFRYVTRLLCTQTPTSIAIPSLIILFIIVSNPCIPLSFCYTYYRKLLYFCVFHSPTKHHIQCFKLQILDCFFCRNICIFTQFSAINSSVNISNLVFKIDLSYFVSDHFGEFTPLLYVK